MYAMSPKTSPTKWTNKTINIIITLHPIREHASHSATSVCRSVACAHFTGSESESKKKNDLSVRKWQPHCGKSHGKECLQESLEATSENRHTGCGHVGAGCSKYGQQQQGRTDRRRWTAVYDGHSATVRKQIEGVSGPRNRLCTRALRRDASIRRCCRRRVPISYTPSLWCVVKLVMLFYVQMLKIEISTKQNVTSGAKSGITDKQLSVRLWKLLRLLPHFDNYNEVGSYVSVHYFFCKSIIYF